MAGRYSSGHRIIAADVDVDDQENGRWASVRVPLANRWPSCMLKFVPFYDVQRSKLH